MLVGRWEALGHSAHTHIPPNAVALLQSGMNNSLHHIQPGRCMECLIDLLSQTAPSRTVALSPRRTLLNGSWSVGDAQAFHTFPGHQDWFRADEG